MSTTEQTIQSITHTHTHTHTLTHTHTDTHTHTTDLQHEAAVAAIW